MPKVTCSIEGCEKPVIAKGLCDPHYRRLRKWGDPLGRRITNAEKQCTIEGCERSCFGHGYCQMHYQRWRSGKDPAVDPPRALSLEQRFWSHVDKDGPIPTHVPRLGPCWPWTAYCIPTGYGVFGLSDGRTELAHRFAWMHFMGPLTADKPNVLHHCDNPACVRFDLDPLVSHLFDGTQQDNMDDKTAKGRGPVLAPCGTAAAAKRHRGRGEELCEPCKEAEREYYNDWYARSGRDLRKRRSM